MADGPMSTPRRPEPRSMGTPSTWTIMRRAPGRHGPPRSRPRRLSPPSGAPAHPGERDPSPHVEDDSLALQQLPLGDLLTGRGAEAHSADGVDDPMPRHPGAGRLGVQRVTHLSRMSG